MQRVALLNGKNINQDFDVSKLLSSLVNSGVVSGLSVTSGQVSAGYAFIQVTRDSIPFYVLFENTDVVNITTTGTKKVWISIDQTKVDDGSNNAVDGSGVGSIQTGASYPSSNYIPLASITAGVITDERSFISYKGGKFEGNLIINGLLGLNMAASMTAAATVDLGTADGNTVPINGNTAITGLGTVDAGVEFTLVFNGTPILTHNATSLILPTGANIQVEGGDTAIVVSLGSGNWKCVSYNRFSGAPLGSISVGNLKLSGFVAGEDMPAKQAFRPGLLNYAIPQIGVLSGSTNNTGVFNGAWQEFIIPAGKNVNINQVIMRFITQYSSGVAQIEIRNSTGATILCTSSNFSPEYFPYGSYVNAPFGFTGVNLAPGTYRLYGKSVSISGTFLPTYNSNLYTGGISSEGTIYDLDFLISGFYIEDVTKEYKASGLLNTPVKGFTESSVSANATFSGITDGNITGLTGLTAGKPVYVKNDGSVGHIGGTYNLKVGNAISSTAFNIDKEYFSIIAGTDITIAEDLTTENTENNTDYTIPTKAITVLLSGVYSVIFECQHNSGSWNSQFRIFKNGVAYGTERNQGGTGFVSYSEDLTFSAGDIVGLYTKVGSTGYLGSCQNFRIKCKIQDTKMLQNTGIVA